MPEAINLEEKLEAARKLREPVLELREKIEADRQLPQPVLEGIAATGIFCSMFPASAGGEEWDWPSWLRVVEELSTVDAAVGWVAGPGGSVNAVLSGWVSDELGCLLSEDPIGLVAGSGQPRGTARRVDGGYVLSGRWQWGSSSPHASWFVGGYALEGEDPRFGPFMFFPAKEVEIIDTWHVGGLRGTGSHDYAVSELFVPEDHAVDVVEPPIHTGPLYRLPVILVLGSGLGPLCLGVARGALDCFVGLMEQRVDKSTGALLRDRPTIQERFAQAEATSRSARAFLYETVEELWEAVNTEGHLTDEQSARGRLALMHAVSSGAQAVDLVYHAAGSPSIFNENLMDRFFRDIHVATQHRVASPEEMFRVGKVMLESRAS